MIYFHTLLNFIAGQCVTAFILTPATAVVLAIGVGFIVALFDHRLPKAALTAAAVTVGAQYLLMLISRLLNVWPDSQAAAQTIRDIVGADHSALPLTLIASLLAVMLTQLGGRAIAAIEIDEDHSLSGGETYCDSYRAQAEARFKAVLRQ